MFSRLLFLLPAFFFCTFQSFAQAFEAGLLVRSNGDTLRGEIENSFWVEPPTLIRFRRTAGSPAETFQPRQLLALSFTNGRYFRYETLALDHGAETRLNQLPLGNVANVKVDSVLAEVLVEGPVTLFKVVLPGATHYLLRRPGQPVLDLSARLYLNTGAQTTGARAYVDGNNYRGQLGIYFGDCSAAATAAQAAPFTDKGMVSVVQAYNLACSPARQPGRAWLQAATPRRRVALLGGLLAGVRYNYIESSYPSPACIDCQPQPFGGLYAELFFPSRVAAMYGELSSGTFRSQGLQLARFTYIPFAYRAWVHTARLGIRFFFALPREQQWLLGLGYELNAVSNRTGIPAGAAPAILINQETGYGMGVLIPNLSVGWRKKRVTVALDGQLYRGFDDVSTGKSSSPHFSVRLGLGYRLGRNPDVAAPALPTR